MRTYMISAVIGFIGLLSLIIGLGFGASDEGDIERFVRVRYKHGLPYHEAVRFNESATPTLIRMLADEKQKPYWPNIVLMMGIIGDKSTTTPLIDFMENRFRGEVDLDTFNALLTVPAALGHAAYKNNQTALEYLLENHTVSKLAGRPIAWHFQKYRGEHLYILLGEMVIRGLAVSGKEPARELLIKMQTDPAPEYAELRRHSKFNISEGIELYDRLVKDGPMKTFAH